MSDWNEFLESWERESQAILSLIPFDSASLPVVVEQKRANYFSSPAIESEIERAERALGTRFPIEMREFYLASNGWTFVGMGDLRLAPVEQIQWVTSVEEEYRRDIDEFFEFDNELFIKRAYKATSLLISNASGMGFCIASQVSSERWEFACAEFGARSEKFDDFLSFMTSMRWYCQHYLRSQLDFME